MRVLSKLYCILTEPLKTIYLSLQDSAVRILDVRADKFNPHKNKNRGISIVKPKVLILTTVHCSGEGRKTECNL